jgi:kynurenine formamidase
MYDLTHPIEAGMQTYPGDPEVSVEDAATHDADGYRVSELACGSHTGTHVDAPAHTEAEGRTLDEYPVSSFVLDTALVDCRGLDARESIPPERVPRTDADCLLFRTGWDEHWGTERYLDHPYLSVDAAQRCVNDSYAVAIDTLSPDPTMSPRSTDSERDGFGAHHALLGAGQLVFENLTNLDPLPERFELRAYPLALGGDGAPVRAVGVDPAGVH